MKIIFFGSDEFSVPSLKGLVNSGHNVACVVTQPDKRKGRGLHKAFTPVKDAANLLKLQLYQPQNVNSKEAIQFLSALEADLFVVIAYGQILSEEALGLPKIFCINVHASLLPKYRGAAPINRALINGEKETGISVIRLTVEMDAGPVILQKRVPIQDTDNAHTLKAKLAEIGQGALYETTQLIAEKTFKEKVQDSSQATFAFKLKKEDGLINWKTDAFGILNLIRGCYDWPGAHTFYKGKMIKIYQAVVFPAMEDSRVIHSPGVVSRVMSDGIVICTGSGDLVIEELQIEGKRKVLARDFIAGHKIQVGDMLG